MVKGRFELVWIFALYGALPIALFAGVLFGSALATNLSDLRAARTRFGVRTLLVSALLFAVAYAVYGPLLIG